MDTWCASALWGVQGGHPLPRGARLTGYHHDGFSEKLIERYRALKAEAPGCLLLMQVGAFMQVMDIDARAVAAVTGLKLQVGGDPDAPTVLGGFPKSGLDQYIGQLARAGYSVAVALQDADKQRQLAEVIRVQIERPGAAG